MLSPYILLPTMMALINPKLGKFNVTAKGGVVKRTFFDTRIAQPFLIMLLFNIAGLLIAIPRFFIWDRDRPGTVLMNVIWCCFNVVILGVRTAVAREMRQLRTTVRISIVTPVMAKLPDGRLIAGETIDMSSGGTSIRFGEAVEARAAVRGAAGLSAARRCAPTCPPPWCPSEGSVLRVRFEDLTIAEQEVLTMVLYSRADSWLGWGESRESDNVLRSLARIFQISMHGLASTFQSLFTGKDRQVEEGPHSSRGELGGRSWRWRSLLMGGAACCAGAGSGINAGALAGKEFAAKNRSCSAPGQFRDTFTLTDAGSPQIELHGIDTSHNIYFTLPQTHVSATAKIHVYYAFSPSLLAAAQPPQADDERTLFATIQPTPGPAGGSNSQSAEAEFNIPPELLVHNNTLTIEFIGHYTMVCEDPANTTLWARVHRITYLDIQGDLLPLADDLKQLPMPFLDPAVIQPLSIPVVFPSAPSFKAIQAAGIVTSYFGMISENRPVRFPVHIGAIPPGNAIVISDNPGNLPAGLNLLAVASPTVAMRTNPNDPYGKVLMVAGADPDQMVRAAQAVALHTRPAAGRAGDHRHTATCPTSSSPTARRAGRVPTRPLHCGTTPLPTSCRATAPRRSTSTSAFRRTSSTPNGPTPSAAGLPLQLDSHRPHLQHAGAHQQRLPWLGAADSRTGSLAQNANRRARAGGQPAPVLQLALVRLHFPAAQEGRLPGHHAHQHAGRNSARYLPRSARLSALRADAQP